MIKPDSVRVYLRATGLLRGCVATKRQPAGPIVQHEPQDITGDTYISVAMNPVSSDRKRKRMKTQQRMETEGRGGRGREDKRRVEKLEQTAFEASLF